jgi:hypothetical protein
MIQQDIIPYPIIFNPLKHNLQFIKEFIDNQKTISAKTDMKDFLKDLKHLGTSVMDIYTGELSQEIIFKEVTEFLILNRLTTKILFSKWVQTDCSILKIISLSDSSQWILKYHDNEKRFVHIFPARQSPHSFRVKANTLKSAILYYTLIGKDYITGGDLNRARAIMGLSPVKDPTETEAITEMIEILRK